MSHETSFILSTTRAVKTVIWHLRVVFRTERQAYRIPKCIRKGEEETDERIHWKRLGPFFFLLIFLKWRFPRRLTPSRWQSRDNWNIPFEGNWDVLTHLFWQSGKISLTNLPYKTFFKQLPNFQTQNWRSKYTTLCWRNGGQKKLSIVLIQRSQSKFPQFFPI